MKRLIVILGIVVAIVLIAMIGLRVYTKSFSPEDSATYIQEDLQVEVIYCRPYAAGRPVFGNIVPYNEVWRTGANEATVLKTSVDLTIGEKVLPAGTYSLFTKPGEDSWEVYVNDETGQWGISVMKGGKANRNPDKDKLQVNVPSIRTEEYFEQFTISLEGMKGEVDLIMMWENTMVVVPMNITNPS